MRCQKNIICSVPFARPLTFYLWRVGRDASLANTYNFDNVIKRHRIYYFKYKGVKVWDRDTRTDLVFGSSNAPAGTDIRTVVAEIDAAAAEEAQRRARAAVAAAASASSRRGKRKGGAAAASSGGAAGAGAGAGSVTSAVVEPAAASARSVPANRPTHFVMVRITSSKIKARVEQLQAALRSMEPRLEPAFLKLNCLHVTLATMHLATPEAVSRAATVLASMSDELGQLLDADAIKLKFDGVTAFRDRVLVSVPVANPNFMAFQASLVAKLQVAGNNTMSKPHHCSWLLVGRALSKPHTNTL